MKKINILIISLVLILVGCERDNSLDIIDHKPINDLNPKVDSAMEVLVTYTFEPHVTPADRLSFILGYRQYMAQYYTIYSIEVQPRSCLYKEFEIWTVNDEEYIYVPPQGTGTSGANATGDPDFDPELLDDIVNECVDDLPEFEFN